MLFAEVSPTPDMKQPSMAVGPEASACWRSCCRSASFRRCRGRAGEAELVGVDLFVGKGGLVTERGQRPALRGFDAHGIDLDSAEGVVDDLRIGCSGNRAVRADSDGQHGGHGHGHLGGCGVAADAAVSGAGRERDGLEVPVPPDASTVLAAEAEMARDAIMQIARTRETIFLVFFMVKILLCCFEKLVFDGDGDDGPGRADNFAGLRGQGCGTSLCIRMLPAGSSTSRAARSILLPTGIALD